MADLSSDIVQSQFEYNDETKKSQCKKCEKSYSGKHTGNLRKHLQKFHSQHYNKLLKEEENDNQQKITSFLEKDADSSKIEVKFYMSINDFWDACVEIVSENGRPLSALQDSGFKKI
jgi:hypothetical protein